MSEEHEILDDDGYVVDIERQKQRVEPPPMYNVVMLNDDFTPMDWVVAVLKTHFSKTEEAAAMIRLEVHQSGKGIAGTFTKDVAQTKATIVNEASQSEGYPFKCEAEQA